MSLGHCLVPSYFHLKHFNVLWDWSASSTFSWVLQFLPFCGLMDLSPQCMELLQVSSVVPLGCEFLLVCVYHGKFSFFPSILMDHLTGYGNLYDWFLSHRASNVSFLALLAFRVYPGKCTEFSSLCLCMWPSASFSCSF